MYKIEIEERCLRELKKLDKKFVEKAFSILSTTLAKDPYLGKQLKGEYSGLFSYRFSDYRIVYEIIEKAISIVVLRIGHRKNVYDGL
jgi:mRNA interferase RelE/StbE